MKQPHSCEMIFSAGRVPLNSAAGLGLYHQLLWWKPGFTVCAASETATRCAAFPPPCVSFCCKTAVGRCAFMQAEEETEPSETGKTLEQRSKLFAAFACSNQTASLYQSNEVLLIALSCPHMHALAFSCIRPPSSRV